MRVSLAAVAVTALASAGLIGFQLLDNDRDAERPEHGLGDVSRSSGIARLMLADSPEFDLREADHGIARPGSLQSYLLAAIEDTRNHLFGLTLRDNGHECPAVQSTWVLDRQGSAWRASCGDALVYWIDVDEFGHLAVEAAPYGDIGPQGTPMRNVPTPLPNGGNRSLDLIERPLERR